MSTMTYEEPVEGSGESYTSTGDLGSTYSLTYHNLVRPTLESLGHLVLLTKPSRMIDPSKGKGCSFLTYLFSSLFTNLLFTYFHV